MTRADWAQHEKPINQDPPSYTESDASIRDRIRAKEEIGGAPITTQEVTDELGRMQSAMPKRDSEVSRVRPRRPRSATKSMGQHSAPSKPSETHVFSQIHRAGPLGEHDGAPDGPPTVTEE